MSLEEFDKAIQVLWNAIKDELKEKEKLKEDIKKLEEGLFMCNELKNSYKVGNEKAIEYIKQHTNKLTKIRVPKLDFNYEDLLNILEGNYEYNK